VPRVPSIPTTSLQFRGGPTFANVTIDDVAVGRNEDVVRRGVRVRSGPHQISVEADGYFPSDQTIQAFGVQVQVSLEMTKLPD
jgi:hypothetical protein